VDVLDRWEQIDRQLQLSGQGDIINRIIVAHRCLESQCCKIRYPIGRIRADWRRLARCPDKKLADLHALTAQEAQRFPSYGVVRLAAELTAKAVAAPWQVAVIFAAGTGMDLAETRQLLSRMTRLSANALFVRASRVYLALKSPGAQAKGTYQPTSGEKQ